MRVLLCLAFAGLLADPAAAADQLPRRAVLHLDDFEKSKARDELLNVVGTDLFTASSCPRSGATCSSGRSPAAPARLRSWRDRASRSS
jgi:hypothetical protein